eukprot:CAMPEP_0113525442 /NCGR_PEP_ID=MMETSP0015_2-20120614/164_1 /TAXON_ID=2838 /ORGANISM="Odontella" /LENGTH=383 /DNA_ID=CAMNT_0000423609 /DNA_START=204 /DNA_END=1354 /DNA_ORIENTATION=- /assembly_acc=CAM_ASM_000160
MTPSQQSKICDNNISRDQGTNTSPQLVLDSEAADHTRKVSEALMRMELEESAPSSPREENISDRSGQATPPLHWDCVESASPRQVAVAPNGDCEGHKRDVLDLVDEAFGGFSDEDKRRKQRVEEIVRTSDHSQGGVGSPKDNLVAALDMKPRRSVCYKEGGKESSVWFGEEHDESAPSVSVSLPSLHASLPTTMSPRQACRPSRSILRKADSEPFNMSILRKFDSESLPSPKNIQEIHRRNELRRQVTFHSVTIREYPMTVGDHPNCSYGPPVSLGWDYDEYESIDMNYFETHRPHRRNLKADDVELLPPQKHAAALGRVFTRRAGYGDSERKASKKAEEFYIYFYASFSCARSHQWGGSESEESRSKESKEERVAKQSKETG